MKSFLHNPKQDGSERVAVKSSEPRAVRAAYLRRRKALSDRESHRQLLEYLRGRAGAQF